MILPMRSEKPLVGERSESAGIRASSGGDKAAKPTQSTPHKKQVTNA